MAIIIRKSLSLSPVRGGGSSKPIIGWHNLVRRSNVTADYEDQYSPASNLGNPSTASQWLSTSSEPQSLTIVLGAPSEIDYIGIARHNLGSDGAEIVVRAKLADNPSVWTTVFSGAVLPDDGPAILQFDPVITLEVSISIVPNDTVPRIGVLYVGKLTVLSGGMSQEVVPIPYSDETEVVTGRAESGDFLGRIVVDQQKRLEYEFLYVSYDWFHAHMGGFARASMVTPFFFAWLPSLYPSEVAFGWLQSDLRPVASRFGNTVCVNFTMEIGALAR